MKNIENGISRPKNKIFQDTKDQLYEVSYEVSSEIIFGEVCKQIPQSELANLTKILNKNLSIDV